MLKLLGKLFKGAATVVGLGTASAGAATYVGAPFLGIDANTVEFVRQLAALVTAFGGVLAAFGLGRKAGWAVPDAEKK